MKSRIETKKFHDRVFIVFLEQSITEGKIPLGEIKTYIETLAEALDMPVKELRRLSRNDPEFRATLIKLKRQKFK